MKIVPTRTSAPSALKVVRGSVPAEVSVGNQLTSAAATTAST